MTRYFGIAGIQMAVEPWNADGDRGQNARCDDPGQPQLSMGEHVRLPRTGRARAGPVHADGTTGHLAAQREPIPGPLTDRLCAIAAEARRWFVPGSMYELDQEKIYNTALVISPEGKIVAKYRKMFPWLPFEAGTEAGDDFCVFDIPDVGRFGLCICYDTWFPETVRNLAWMGAEVIIHPTMTPTSDRTLELVIEPGQRHLQPVLLCRHQWGRARGVAVDRMIVDPDGRVLQQAGEHETILTEILDLDNVRKAREFGSLGLCQLWKQLRDTRIHFPIYTNGVDAGEIFRDLGHLRKPRRLKHPDR